MSRAVSCVALLLLGCGDAAITQPIQYNHSVHVGKLKVDCATCHEGSHDQVTAGLPPLSACGPCHAEAEGSAEQRKVAAAVAANQEIPWVRLYELPRHVFFSHRRHTETAKIACEECHGPMGQQTRPPRAALRTMTMTTCMDCHHRHAVSEDCTTCHR